MTGYTSLDWQAFVAARKKINGIPIPAEDLQFIASTLKDLIALVFAAHGKTPFIEKGREALTRIERRL